MNPNENENKVITASDKLRALIPNIRAKLMDALKNDPLVLFACECFLLLVSQVMDDLEIVLAKNEVAVLGLKKVADQLDRDGKEIVMLRKRAETAESEARTLRAELIELRKTLAN